MAYLKARLAILTVLPLIALASAGSSPWTDSQLQMLNLTNVQRAKAGVAPLCGSASLMASALAHSQYQASIDTMTHNDPISGLLDRFSKQGFSPQSGAENVGMSSQFNIQTLMTDWMSDSEHAGNILGANYQFFGAAAVQGQDGNYYWTQHFAATLNPTQDTCMSGSGNATSSAASGAASGSTGQGGLSGSEGFSSDEEGALINPIPSSALSAPASPPPPAAPASPPPPAAASPPPPAAAPTTPQPPLQQKQAARQAARQSARSQDKTAGARVSNAPASGQGPSTNPIGSSSSQQGAAGSSGSNAAGVGSA